MIAPTVLNIDYDASLDYASERDGNVVTLIGPRTGVALTAGRTMLLSGQATNTLSCRDPRGWNRPSQRPESQLAESIPPNSDPPSRRLHSPACELILPKTVSSHQVRRYISSSVTDFKRSVTGRSSITTLVRLWTVIVHA